MANCSGCGTSLVDSALLVGNDQYCPTCVPAAGNCACGKPRGLRIDGQIIGCVCDGGPKRNFSTPIGTIPLEAFGPHTHRWQTHPDETHRFCPTCALVQERISKLHAWPFHDPICAIRRERAEVIPVQTYPMPAPTDGAARDRDGAAAVACPVCNAPVGSPCAGSYPIRNAAGFHESRVRVWVLEHPVAANRVPSGPLADPIINRGVEALADEATHPFDTWRARAMALADRCQALEDENRVLLAENGELRRKVER